MAARPTPAELAAAEGRFVPDVLEPGLRVLFCGINPGLWSAAVGHHFARPGNRFWKALHLGGLTPRLLAPDEEGELLGLGLGITNLVERATAGAAELGGAELRAGGAGPGRQGGRRPAGGGGRARGRRLPDRLRPAPGGGRPPARGDRAGRGPGCCPTRAASTPTTSSPTWPRRSPPCAGRSAAPRAPGHAAGGAVDRRAAARRTVSGGSGGGRCGAWPRRPRPRRR